MNLKKIKWQDCLDSVSDARLKEVQDKLRIDLPETFLTCVKVCNGGTPVNSEFEYYNVDVEDTWISGIGVFLNLNHSSYSDFLETNLASPEHFPKGLIAFAETGGGNYMCFDYRDNRNHPDPCIVYWFHEGDTGRDVSFLAKNFEEFMNMLKEPDSDSDKDFS